MRQRSMNVMVGFFMLAALLGLLALAFRVSGLTQWGKGVTYQVTALFDTVGGLRVHAPVRIAGVKVGTVDAIGLDPTTFQAQVTLAMDGRFRTIPSDSSASILTQGLLGANYININLGFETKSFLKEGSLIKHTQSAMILENLIGQLLFSMKDKKPAASVPSGASSNVPPVTPSPSTPKASASVPASVPASSGGITRTVDENGVVTLGG